MSEYNKTEPLTHDNFFKKLSDAIEKKAPVKGEDTDALLTFISGKQLMETVYPEQRWLVDSYIPDGGLVCLSGMPSSYKSWFGFYIALSVLKGEPILERFETQKGAVLFIDKENIEPQIQDRMRMLGAGKEMENCYFTQGNFTTENLGSLAAVVQFVKEKNIKLVIIDSLIRVHSRNENDAVEMNRVFERLTEIQLAGPAVLYLHHLRKPVLGSTDPMERLRGSIDISARLDSLIAVENEKNFITVTHGKSRYTEAVPPFVMEFYVDKKTEEAFFSYHKEVEAGAVEEFACDDEIVRLLGSGSFSRQLLINTLIDRFSERTILRSLSGLVAKGRLMKYRDGNSVIYAVNKLSSFLKDKEKEDLN